MSARPHDIAILGATGFTGSFVAEYLAERYPSLLSSGLKVAIAGRSKGKLETVRNDMINASNGALKESDVAILEYDAGDRNSVEAVVGSARVVIACSGPYTRVGTPVVAACVEKGTDYVDITGESPWIRKIIDTYHDEAAEKGTILIPSCGFDSVPSDMGAFALSEFISSRFGEETKSVKITVAESKSGVSGGTLGTIREMLSTSDPDMRKLVRESNGNEYFLNPADKQSGPDKPGFPFYWDSELNSFQGFWVMAPGNSKIVRRSQALLGYPFGNFSYKETMTYKSRLALIAGTAGLAVLGVMMMLPPTRWLLYRFVFPAPGHGTVTKAERKTNYFEMKGVGLSQSGKKAYLRWYGPGDAGYGETPKYAAEAALCLALERERIPGKGKGGIMTSASALGGVYLERLRRVGTVVEVAEKEI